MIKKEVVLNDQQYESTWVVLWYCNSNL